MYAYAATTHPAISVDEAPCAQRVDASSRPIDRILQMQLPWGEWPAHRVGAWGYLTQPWRHPPDRTTREFRIRRSWALSGMMPVETPTMRPAPAATWERSEP
jgi:hypothetical protein